MWTYAIESIMGILTSIFGFIWSNFARFHHAVVSKPWETVAVFEQASILVIIAYGKSAQSGNEPRL
jgi:hypothetical protein